MNFVKIISIILVVLGVLAFLVDSYVGSAAQNAILDMMFIFLGLWINKAYGRPNIKEEKKIEK